MWQHWASSWYYKTKRWQICIDSWYRLARRKDYAEVVTDEEALNAIISTGHIKLLEKKKFEPLKEII